MIYVNKHNKTPKSLLRAKQTEIRIAKEQYKKNKKVSIKFTAYRSDDVKEELRKLFHGKCCYCETKVLANSPGAIEHFRPKGRNQKRYIGPSSEYIGYYWLAAKWENLLFSCTDCNTERKHHVPGVTKKVSIGKQDKFPLLDERYRCTHHGQSLSKENGKYLLINPTIDYPEKYFEFTKDGLIKPLSHLKGVKLNRSLTSIRTYALQRMGLVNARKAFYLSNIGKEFLEVEEMRIQLQLQGLNARQISKLTNTLVNIKIRSLIELVKPDKELSGMAKYLIGEELRIRYKLDFNSILNGPKLPIQGKAGATSGR